MATSRRVGNYATSAKAVVGASDQIFNAAMTGRPDFTAISKEAIKGRSLERRTAMEAEGQVAKAGINALSKVKQTRMKIDAAEDVANSKRSAQRMAGVVAGLGTLSGAMVLKKENSIAKRERAEEKADMARTNAATNALLQKSINDNKKFMESLMNGSSINSSSDASNDSDPAPAVATAPTTTTTSTDVPTNVSANHSASSTGALTKQEVNKYALDAGFTPQQARTVVGIAGGESGFDPTNSTKRSGLYDQTGEDSVGLMQINWGYHKDKGWLQDLGITSREQLLDPATNMKAAKYLHDGRQGFGDWTVYNKDIYKNFL